MFLLGCLGGASVVVWDNVAAAAYAALQAFQELVGQYDYDGAARAKRGNTACNLHGVELMERVLPACVRQQGHPSYATTEHNHRQCRAVEERLG
jgi:hypothetical protein